MCIYGQLGEEEGVKEGFRISIEGLHVAEKAGRLFIIKTRQVQQLHILRSLSLGKGVDEGTLQCIIFAISR